MSESAHFYIVRSCSSNMGKFPVIYMGSLSNGVCMGGLVPVLVNILILSMDVNIQMAGFSCFAFGCIMVVLCLVLFRRMEKSEFYQHYSSIKTGIQLKYDLEFRVVSCLFILYVYIAKRNTKLTWALFLEILSTSWLFILTAFLQTTTTSLVYPAATSLVKPVEPTESDWHQIYFVQVSLYKQINYFSLFENLSFSIY